MINFKISVFEGLEDCRRVLLPRYDSIKNLNRYRVFINNIERVGALDTFDLEVDANTNVEVLITDIIGEYSTYKQSFNVFNRDIWVDIHLLRNKTRVRADNDECHLGINGENQNEFNNQGDFLGGSNYFEWEIQTTNNFNINLNVNSTLLKVERPRDANNILLPPLSDDFNNAGDSLSTNSFLDYVVTDRVIQGYESYFTPVLDVLGNISHYYIPIKTFGYTLPFYLTYMLQSGVTTGGCCGSPQYHFEDCEYNFEVTRTQEKVLDYCNAEFNLIDIPCSKNKYLYSGSKNPLTFQYYCNGKWITIGAGTKVYFDVSNVCNQDEIRIKATCDRGYSDCCGSGESWKSQCEKEYTFKNIEYCADGNVDLLQIICKDTLGCDDCGIISYERFITEQPVNIKLEYNLNNKVYYHYHNQITLLSENKTESLIDNVLKTTTELSPCFNTITYQIKKIDKLTKTEPIIYISNPLEILGDRLDIDFTFNESGIYKIEVFLQNCCKISIITKEIYIHSKKEIEQLDCTKYRLFHCIDKDTDELVIRNYITKEIYYSNLKVIEGVETDVLQQGIKVKYNEDLFTYDIEFLTDNLYEVFITDLDGTPTTFLVLHHCFITNCHQEFVKALLCEEPICDELLEKCLVTDKTLLRVYNIQKYILLYDIFKTMLSKIVNLDYKHIIEPVTTLEDMSCINLYELQDIINKLKEMCVSCGYKTNEEINDCGCK